MKCIIGFKGKNNASCILANYLCESPYLLTNSFKGIKKDIEQLDNDLDYLLMFGIDKNLEYTVKIEAVAEKDNCTLLSNLNLNSISKRLSEEGIANYISNNPTYYLCNEAYWYALRKYNGNAVFMHIPSIKKLDNDFLQKMKLALS